jgi:hypothetical protein
MADSIELDGKGGYDKASLSAIFLPSSVASVKGSSSNAVVVQMTHNHKFKGLNPADTATMRK